MGHRHLCKFHIHRGRYSRKLQYNLKLWVRSLNISSIEPKYILPYKKKLVFKRIVLTYQRVVRRHKLKKDSIIELPSEKGQKDKQLSTTFCYYPYTTPKAEDQATRNPQKTRGDMCHWWSGNTKPTKVRQLYKQLMALLCEINIISTIILFLLEFINNS